MPGLGRAPRSTRRFTRPSPRPCARRGWMLADGPLSSPCRTAPRNDRRIVPFCALPTVTPRISWPVASRSWEVLSDATPGQSSSTVLYSSSDPTGPPNSWESAIWPGSPRTLALGLDRCRRELPGRWSSTWSHATYLPPSAAGPPSWKKRFIGSPAGQDDAELCHTKLDGQATFKKEHRKRCVPKIPHRQVCQGSWNSETLSYNVGESRGGSLHQSISDSRTRRYTSIYWSVRIGRGKQQENWSRRSPAGVRKTRRDRNEVRGQAGFGSGSCFFITPFGASWTVGPRPCPRAWGLSPWGDTVVRVDAGHHRC